MDTDHEPSDDPIEVERWSEYVEKYVSKDDTVSDDLKEHLNRKPVFLPRWISHVFSIKLQTVVIAGNCVCRTIKFFFFPVIMNYMFPDNHFLMHYSYILYLFIRNVRQWRLQQKKSRSDAAETEELPGSPKQSTEDMDILDNTECKFNVNSFKIVYVVNSEYYLYKRTALTKAREVGREREREREKGGESERDFFFQCLL